MDRETVYLIGPTKGPRSEWQPVFEAARQMLERKGYGVMSPVMIADGMYPGAYLPIRLSMLEECDYVYLMDGWDQSPMARVEMGYAECQGIGVL